MLIFKHPTKKIACKNHNWVGKNNVVITANDMMCGEPLTTTTTSTTTTSTTTTTGLTCDMLDEDWGTWSECSATCHSESVKAIRSRYANNADCANSETEDCSVPDCPYWIWSAWSSCSGPCGHETRTRTATSCSTDDSANSSGDGSGEGSGESSGEGSAEGSAQGSGEASGETSGEAPTECDGQPETETESCKTNQCRWSDHIIYDIDPAWLESIGFVKYLDRSNAEYVPLDSEDYETSTVSDADYAGIVPDDCCGSYPPDDLFIGCGPADSSTIMVGALGSSNELFWTSPSWFDNTDGEFSYGLANPTRQYFSYHHDGNPDQIFGISASKMISLINGDIKTDRYDYKALENLFQGNFPGDVQDLLDKSRISVMVEGGDGRGNRFGKLGRCGQYLAENTNDLAGIRLFMYHRKNSN